MVDQRVQTFNCKMNRVRGPGCDAVTKADNASISSNLLRVELKSSHSKKNRARKVTNVLSQRGKSSHNCADAKSSRGALKCLTISFVSYTSVKLKKRKCFWVPQ